jgi:hypothetical protein
MLCEIRDQYVLNDSGMVQVEATHAVTLPWKIGFVQMHALSVGVQVFVPKALLRHSCWDLSVRYKVEMVPDWSTHSTGWHL